jgi:hypothetical protein
VITYNLPPDLNRYAFRGDSGHWFTHRGVNIRSVSKILNRIYPMPDIDPWYLERGRVVHESTVLIDEGRLGEVDERIVPFLSAYQTFLYVARPVMEASELVVVHPSYTYGARLDRVIRLPAQDKLLVMDIKCGEGREDRYWLQVAACAMALDEPNVGDYDLALLNLTAKRPVFTMAEDPAGWVNRWRKVLQEDIDERHRS